MSDLPPGLKEFGEQLERAVEREVQQSRRVRRRPRLLRGIGLPVVAALTAAAVTAGAVRIADRNGPPIDPNTGAGGVTSLQAPKDPAVVVSSAVADPSGGPPWVLRVYSNAAGHDCVQLGRLSEGVFGQVQQGRFRALPASAEGTCSDGTRHRALVAVNRRGSLNLTLVFGLATDRAPVVIRYRGRERRVRPVALGAFLTLFSGADPSNPIIVRTTVGGRVDERRFPND